MLTLINGEKLIVREDTAEVVERVLAYRRPPAGLGWPGGCPPWENCSGSSPWPASTSPACQAQTAPPPRDEQEDD